MKNNQQTTTSPPRRRPSRILFGSCNSQHYDQVLWPNIRSRNATAFVWGGDAIYGDRNIEVVKNSNTVIMNKAAGTPEGMRRMYLDQLAHPQYSALLKELHVFGTIDDHDYGIDNGDTKFKHKREAAVEYVETFLRQDPDSAMAKRARSGAGVYAVKLYDFSRPVGQELLSDEEAGIDPDVTPAIDEATTAPYSNRSVAVFVIDIRSHKTPYCVDRIQRYYPDYDGDFLGETQRLWLQEGLSRSKASVNIVVSGLQVHADKFPDPNVYEAWGQFPTAQQRLYDALLNNDVKMPILISGDVHHAALSRRNCVVKGKEQDSSRPLLELTTSGMTHAWAASNVCAAPTTMCKTWYLRFAAKTAMTFFYWVNPWTEVLIANEVMEGAKSGLQYSVELNFGELEFDWDNRMVQARVLGLNKETPQLSVQWSMDTKFLNKNQGERSWQCVNHRGVVHPIRLAIAQAASAFAVCFFVSLPTVVMIILVVFMYRLGFRSNKKKSRTKVS